MADPLPGVAAAIPPADIGLAPARDTGGGWRTAWFVLRRSFGLPGAVGVGLLVAGAALLLLAGPALRKDAARLQHEAAASRDERNAQRARALSGPGDSQAVQQFLQGFPPSTSQLDDLSFLIQQARAAGVELARAEYQMRNDAGIGLVRYQVSLPVTARYATLRGFVASVLNGRTHASLDELSIERKEADVVEARVRFTFIYRSADAQ